MATRSVATSHLTTMAAWTFLPPVLSRLLLSAFYTVSPSSRPSVSASRSPAQIKAATTRAQTHHRRARIVLVVGYLIYTILSTFHAQSSSPASQNYYTLLGLPRSVVEAEGSPVVKSHFRKLARTHHPDKVGPAGAEHFVLLRKGAECLQEDNARWSYERWGPAVLDWKAVTKRDFVVKGSQSAVAFYVFAIVSLALLAIFRKEERAYSFWRMITLLLTLSLEFFLALRPTPSPLMSLLIPRRLPFEQIAILRQAFVASSLAFSQVAPLLYPPSPSPPTLDEIDDEIVNVQRGWIIPLLGPISKLPTSSEDVAAAAAAFMPAHVGGERRRGVFEDVKDAMVDMLTERRVRAHPELGKLWDRAVEVGVEREERRRRAHTVTGAGALAGAAAAASPARAATVGKDRPTAESAVTSPAKEKNGKKSKSGAVLNDARLPSPPPDD